MLSAWKCGLCTRLQKARHDRCKFCNYPNLQEISLDPREYCKAFGHNGGTVRIEGTSKNEGYHHCNHDAGEYCLCDTYKYSHEYLFKCARCGYEKRYRK